MSQDEMTNPRPGKAEWHHPSISQKLGVITGFVAIFFLVVIIITWLWSPTYKILFNSLADQEAITVLNTLYSNGFDAKLDESSGAILVPASDIHIARIKLSNLGLSGMHNLHANLQDESFSKELKDNGSVQSHVRHIQRTEEILSRRIERILEPLVGSGSVRAQVTINYGTGEKNSKTHKTEDPESGLLSLDRGKVVSDKGTGHESALIGRNNNLSISVIVNDKQVVGIDGNVSNTPRTPEELEKITGLIKTATGFNSKRGDSINVVNSTFAAPLVSNSVTREDVLDNIWYQERFRKGVGVTLVVLLISFSIWYLLRALPGFASVPPLKSVQNDPIDQRTLDPAEVARKNFDDNMRVANVLAENDPKLVAQIIKNWISADGR